MVLAEDDVQAVFKTDDFDAGRQHGIRWLSFQI